MSIPYRARRNLRRLFTTVLILALVIACVLLCWFLWLHRYVVYTRDGVKLDFDRPLEYPQGEIAVPPDTLPSVHIQYDNGVQPEEEVNTELVRFSGYYVTLEKIKEDFSAVEAQLQQLPAKSTVLIEVKNIQSYTYFSTDVGMIPDNFDTLQMDELIQKLRDQGHYVIAKIPAFQEYAYFLADERGRVPFGLPRKGGNGSLWLDGTIQNAPCYWLNPASDGTLTYLIQTITELRLLGFDEVVLDGFRFPDTDLIAFEGDQQLTLEATADKLVKTCATDTFCVSFVRSAADLKLPAGRTRLYLTGVAATSAASVAMQTDFEDPTLQVVFLADSGDTRYDEFCVLRPIDMMH